MCFYNQPYDTGDKLIGKHVEVWQKYCGKWFRSDGTVVKFRKIKHGMYQVRFNGTQSQGKPVHIWFRRNQLTQLN